MKMHAYRYISIFTAKNRSLFSSGCGAEKAKTPHRVVYTLLLCRSSTAAAGWWW